ncbi:Glycoprotein-N-acetylgalactosamine 3-beta-galactosyltransferase 1 [Strongyloides ratti]|uniref:N-acetylgalactosaminide beta-1,3-galactosyltransferase n=1 Tax=Strongyloides ratti TaxID=34506 RepID=A0A090LQ42_STRRB|nr:Glycoprotein-N-acetylgalactosamine 3-beta-galactosyltransferase 1 [Strongyloides ratti]CEF69661.1 Glycoprotein-N-acetylgalactosamine 3-beta-galactosyltransferase 1 [Strongyloides ratti]
MNNTFYNVKDYLKFQKSYDNSVFENLSNELMKSIKIFCIILTTPKNKNSKCLHQKNTWLKKCNNYIFASSIEDKTLPSIKSYPKDEYKYSYGKIKNTLKWVWTNYKDEYDYILKADDDTYFVMENLRAYLINQNSSEDAYFGFRIYNPPGDIKKAYIQGGSGYIFSKKTFNILVENGLDNKKYCCQRDDMYDDMEIGRCLFRMGINSTFLVDNKNKVLFNPRETVSTVSERQNIENEFQRFSLIHLRQGLNTIGDFPISFHRVSGDFMYLFEYLFYHAEIIGMKSRLFRMEDNDNHNNKIKVRERIRLIKAFSNYNYKKL